MLTDLKAACCFLYLPWACQNPPSHVLTHTGPILFWEIIFSPPPPLPHDFRPAHILTLCHYIHGTNFHICVYRMPSKWNLGTVVLICVCCFSARPLNQALMWKKWPMLQRFTATGSSRNTKMCKFCLLLEEPRTGMVDQAFGPLLSLTSLASFFQFPKVSLKFSGWKDLNRDGNGAETGWKRYWMTP